MIPPIGVADLFRAWHALGAHDAQSRRMIRDALLGDDGIDWEPVKEAAAKPPAPGAGDEAPPARRPPSSHPPAPTEREDGAGWDEPVQIRVEEVESIVSRAVEIAAGAPVLARDQRSPVEPEPLLEPGWAPRIVSAFVATDAPLGDVDVARLVTSVVQLRGMRRLPRKIRPTLRKGVQLLLDRDTSMMPLYADQTALHKLVAAIVGRERNSVFRCDTFPPRRVSPLAATKWGPYAPPPPGTPVLIAGDLGMARGAFPLSSDAERRWDEFLGPLREAGSPVLALVPCHPERYPPFVRANVRLVLWDSRTRPSDARRARRERSPR